MQMILLFYGIRIYLMTKAEIFAFQGGAEKLIFFRLNFGIQFKVYDAEMRLKNSTPILKFSKVFIDTYHVFVLY
jgi:hypothetical protein